MSDALELLQRTSGGDLYLLFALIIKAGRLAGYRNEDEPATPRKIMLVDAAIVAREQLRVCHEITIPKFEHRYCHGRLT